MTEKRKLSTREKVDYVPALISIGGTAIAAPVTGLFRGSNGADTYRHHIVHSLIRKFNSRLNSLQAQAFAGSFEHIYEKWCKSNRITPDIVDSDRGVRGFWIGDKTKAKHVIVYFHGGGFAIDGSDGHINFWSKVQQHLARSDVPTAFFFVLYTLTPHALYPTQLRESIAAVKYLVEDCHRSPNELLLAGDSAGGNLAVATLLHMSEPCPEVGNDFTIDVNFKGLILMAPWVSFETDWPSFTENKHRDYIEADVEGRWSAEYIGVKPKPRARNRDITTGDPDTHPNSIWAEPALAPTQLWAGAKCDKILVVYGSHEALIGGIEDWVAKYKEGIGQERVDSGAISVCVGANEVHIAPLVWPMFGDNKECETAIEIKRWMIENLSTWDDMHTRTSSVQADNRKEPTV